MENNRSEFNLIQSFTNDDLQSTRSNKDISLYNTLNGFEEYTLNELGVIISSNLEVVNVTGYEEWEVIGKHISLLYSDEDILNKYPEMHLQSAADKGQVVVSDWKLKKKKI